MTNAEEQPVVVYLRNPVLAAFLAWLIPGAGHLYQRRYVKAAIFFVCIMSTYYFGLALGQGKVVYAASDRWLQFACQFGVGLPTLPAAIQAHRAGRGQAPLWGGFMAPPQRHDGWGEDELSRWHRLLATRFEVATLYTMVAGLLNIITIFDAYDGPLVPSSGSENPGESSSENSEAEDRTRRRKSRRGGKQKGSAKS